MYDVKSIGIGRLELDGVYVTGLRYALDDARVASLLAAAGLASKLYAGKPDGRVLDLVRQLVRLRTDAYLFHVSSASAEPTAQLVKGLRQLRADLRFFFWTADGSEPIGSLEALGERLPAGDVDGVVAAILAAGGVAASTHAQPSRRSPYLAGLIGAADAQRLGISLDQSAEIVREELRWLAAQGAQARVPLRANSTAGAALVTACEALVDDDAALRFELHTSASGVTSGLIEVLPKARIDRLVIKGIIDAALIGDHAIEIVDSDGADFAERQGRYGANGLAALHTGCYMDGQLAPAIMHLETPVEMSATMRGEVHEAFAQAMAVRSAAVLSGDIDLVLEHIDGVAKDASTPVWPKHTYAIARSGDARQSEAIFDGSASTRLALEYVPLARLRTTSRRPDSRTIVTLDSAEDVAVLEADLQALHAEGVVTVPHPKSMVYYENMCRWLGPSSCGLSSLRRVSVDTAGVVTSCRDAGEIGTFTDGFDQLLLNAKQKRQMEEVKRGCATCPVREQCSRCAQLPALLDGRYCDIRKTYPMASFYFEAMLFPRLLAQYLPEGQDDLVLRMSQPGLPPQHYHGPQGVGREGDRPVIVGLEESVFAWSRVTRRIVRLSAPLALIAEAWWLGADADDVVAELCARFGADEANARQSQTMGLDKLRAAGVVP
jgi:radical SAM protein with 4Fe4S-binding SPASM domain